MQIAGKITSLGLKRKLDPNDKEITILDLRIEVIEGQNNAQALLELPGNHAKLEVKEVQQKLI